VGRATARGRIPAHRTDAGAFLTAEVLGAERCILVKDERGLFTADPKKDVTARFIDDIEVNDLLALDLADLAVERTMLEAFVGLAACARCSWSTAASRAA